MGRWKHAILGSILGFFGLKFQMGHFFLTKLRGNSHFFWLHIISFSGGCLAPFGGKRHTEIWLFFFFSLFFFWLLASSRLARLREGESDLKRYTQKHNFYSRETHIANAKRYINLFLISVNSRTRVKKKTNPTGMYCGQLSCFLTIHNLYRLQLRPEQILKQF